MKTRLLLWFGLFTGFWFSVLPLQSMAQDKNLMQQICDTRPVLKEALKQAGLTATLMDGGPYTFFAPSDEVLKKTLETSPGKVRDLMMNQIVVGKLSIDDLKDGSKLTTLGGAQISVFRKRDEVYINAARISEANIMATNGVMHIVENWLVTPIATN